MKESKCAIKSQAKNMSTSPWQQRVILLQKRCKMSVLSFSSPSFHYPSSHMNIYSTSPNPAGDQSGRKSFFLLSFTLTSQSSTNSLSLTSSTQPSRPPPQNPLISQHRHTLQSKPLHGARHTRQRRPEQRRIRRGNSRGNSASGVLLWHAGWD